MQKVTALECGFSVDGNLRPISVGFGADLAARLVERFGQRQPIGINGVVEQRRVDGSLLGVSRK